MRSTPALKSVTGGQPVICQKLLALSWGQLAGSSRISDNFPTRHLPGVFISWPPFILTPEKAESMLKYLLAIPFASKKKKA